MYLFIGQQAVVHGEEIIGIFDLDNTTVSKHTRNFLNQAQKRDEVEAVTVDIPKAFLVCASPRNKEKKQRVYITQMAPSTLRKRVETYSYE
ncbi:MAG: DUF370 domain-containing protein [Clostridia bacterium]|nr:DUF370 domain-containing protein [Clostridia bacterium]